MKIRESGMPKEELWNKFFDPARVLSKLGINNTVEDVVDFGSGYGTFTIPAAKMITGKIYAIDVERSLIQLVAKKAKEHNLHNVIPIFRDFISEGSGLADSSVDFAMLFNILHLEKPTILLKEAYRVLKASGRVGIIHWNYDPNTPRGPPIDIRPKPEHVRHWAESVGFIFEQQLDLESYHYAMILRKPNQK